MCVCESESERERERREGRGEHADEEKTWTLKWDVEKGSVLGSTGRISSSRTAR